MWDDDYAGDEYGQDYDDRENFELDRLAEDFALEREADEGEFEDFIEDQHLDGMYEE